MLQWGICSVLTPLKYIEDSLDTILDVNHTLYRILYFLYHSFNFILYWFQVYSLVVIQSYTLHSISLNISSTLTGTIHLYHVIIDYFCNALCALP